MGEERRLRANNEGHPGDLSGDRLLPIADPSAGDDPGPPLVLGLYAALSGAVVTETDVSRVNTILNLCRTCKSGGAAFRLRLPFLSFLVLTVGAVIANKLHSLGPHPGHMGVACLVALLPLAILRNSIHRPIAHQLVAMDGRRSAWSGCRNGFPRGDRAYGSCGRSSRPWRQLFLFAHEDAAYGAGSSRRSRHNRSDDLDAVLHPSRSRCRPRHRAVHPDGAARAWHNLYIGLGVVENPFGIVWNDDDGVRAVKEVSPGTLYLSAEYYSILKRKYFEIVLHHPIDVITIYLKKVMKALTTYNMIYLLIVVSGVFAWARLSLVRYSAGWSSYDAVFSVSAVFVATLLGQAALFHYTELYLFPVKIFLVLLFGVMVEILLTLARAGRFEPASRRA